MTYTTEMSFHSQPALLEVHWYHVMIEYPQYVCKKYNDCIIETCCLCLILGRLVEVSMRLCKFIKTNRSLETYTSIVFNHSGDTCSEEGEKVMFIECSSYDDKGSLTNYRF